MRVHIFGKTDLLCTSNWALKRTAPEDDYQLKWIIEKKFVWSIF